MSVSGVRPGRARRVRRALASGLVATALGVAGMLAVPAGPAGAQDPEPTLTVEPTTDLLDGDTLDVSGSGFLANTTIFVLSCPPGVTDGFDCDLDTLSSVTSDASGSFTLEYTAVRVVEGIDCARAACRIGAGDINQVRDALVEVSFAETPGSISLVDPAPLEASQPVEVSGSGFRPNTAVDLGVCGPSFCATGLETVSTDGSGAFDSAFVPAARLLPNDAGTEFSDCLVWDCRVTATQGVIVDQTDPLQYQLPELTVSIGGQGTLQAGTNDAVARATVSCDQQTPVSVEGSVAQPTLAEPTIAGGFAFDDARCSPGDPLQAFIPTRFLTVQDSDFSLGAAEASVSAEPYPGLDQGPAVEATGSVELLDEAALTAAIQTALEDPANSELGAEIEAAIRARLAQDPVFRQEFIALLNA